MATETISAEECTEIKHQLIRDIHTMQESPNDAPAWIYRIVHGITGIHFPCGDGKLIVKGDN